MYYISQTFISIHYTKKDLHKLDVDFPFAVIKIKPDQDQQGNKKNTFPNTINKLFLFLLLL